MKRSAHHSRSLVAVAVALVAALTGCSAGDAAEGAAAEEAADGAAAGTDAEAGADGGSTEIEVASDAVDFTAETVDGEPFEAADTYGSPTVYWFWAPWCTICFGEAAGVRDAADAHEGEVDFVGVPGRGEVDQMQAFITDTGIDNFTQVADEDGTVWAEFEVVSQPSYAFVDSTGAIVDVVPGMFEESELIARAEGLT